MSENSVFECGTPKCTNAIDADSLNVVQLKALRRWKKSCNVCGKQTTWIEKIPLIQIPQSKNHGGSKNVFTQINPTRYHH